MSDKRKRLSTNTSDELIEDGGRRRLASNANESVRDDD